MSKARTDNDGSSVATPTDGESGIAEARSTAARVVPLVQRCVNHVVELTDRVLETELTSEQRGRLTLAQSTATSVLELISDTSDLALLEAAELDVDRVHFNVSELIRDTVTASTPSARVRQNRLHLMLDPDLPQSAVGDPGRIRQLLTNTISFALERTVRGQVSVSALRTDAGDGTMQLTFEVAHSGAPLSPEGLEDVLSLTALDRGVLSTRLAADLGLAIAARLAVHLGGSFDARETSERGPVLSATVALRASESDQSQAVHDEPSSELRVMVATDDYGRVLQLQPLLDSAGVRIVSVCRVEEGIDLLALTLGSEDSPEALLLYALADPAEGAARLGSSRTLARLPAVLVVQRGQRGDAVKYKQNGVAGYLTEPVDPVGLGEALRAAVAIRRNGGSEFVTSHYLRDNRQKLRILIADDSGLSRKLAADLLERRGHTAVVVENGREAIDAWVDGPFDVIVLDLEMPELDGIATCREILALADPEQPPTILGMTTHATDEDLQRATDVGMADCLAKPFRLEDLFVAVEQAASGARESRAAAPNPTGTQPRGLLDVGAAIEQLGSLALFSECVVELKKELPELTARIEEAYEARKFDVLAMTAHRLRGGLATIFADEGLRASRAVELAARAEDEARVGREILRLNSALARLEPEIDAFIVD